MAPRRSRRADLDWVALRMLMGDGRKFVALVFGVSFATTMMAHQLAVFRGVMERTVSFIRNVHPSVVWVMNAGAPYVDEVRPLPRNALYRVRGVPGVGWAAPILKLEALLRTESGSYRRVILVGLDDATMAGCPAFLHGSADQLRRPDAVAVDEAGYAYLWPGEPIRLGREVHLNDRTARLVGVCRVAPPFLTMPVIYTRISVARSAVAPDGHTCTFVLVGPDAGTAPDVLADRIRRQTGYQARSAAAFERQTMLFYLWNTGIPLNFAIVVALGFTVGLAIVGQTFYLFTLVNLNQFGMLKAMGATSHRLVRMVVVQAMSVGVLGYGIGLGGAATVIRVSTNAPHLAGYELDVSVCLSVAFLVMSIVTITAILSSFPIIRLEPGILFRN